MNTINPNHPLARLRNHVTGAIERGEAQAIIEQPTTPAQHTANAKLTPLPWRLDNPYRPDRGIAWRDIVSDHAEFSPCYVGEACGEDAKFILRACNNHERLVETLANCITEPGAMAERSHECALRRLAFIAAQARAALAALNA